MNPALLSHVALVGHVSSWLLCDLQHSTNGCPVVRDAQYSVRATHVSTVMLRGAKRKKNSPEAGVGRSGGCLKKEVLQRVGGGGRQSVACVWAEGRHVTCAWWEDRKSVV